MKEGDIMHRLIARVNYQNGQIDFHHVSIYTINHAWGNDKWMGQTENLEWYVIQKSFIGKVIWQDNGITKPLLKSNLFELHPYLYIYYNTDEHDKYKKKLIDAIKDNCLTSQIAIGKVLSKINNI